VEKINWFNIGIVVIYGGVICLLFGLFIGFSQHSRSAESGDDSSGAIVSELTDEQQQAIGRVDALADLVGEASTALEELRLSVGRQRTLFEAAQERAAYLEDFYRRASVISGGIDNRLEDYKGELVYGK